MLTLQEIDRMPADEYVKKMADPEFVKMVNSLEQPASVEQYVYPAPGEVSSDGTVRPDDPETVVSVPVAPEQIVPALPAPVIPEQEVLAPTEVVVEFQPEDEYGKPLGGKQVFKGKDYKEVNDKIVDAQKHLIRELRRKDRDHRLGIDKDKIPADAEKMDIIDLTPKELTVEERFQLTQDLNDPEKFASARDRLIASSLGGTPEQIRGLLTDAQRFRLETKVQQNFAEFVQLTGPSFYDDEANRTTLTDWMVKTGLAPTVANFETALANVAGLLHGAPVVQQAPPVVPAAQAVVPQAPVEEKPPQASVVPEARISQPEQPQLKPQIQAPSGLNDRVSSTTREATPSVEAKTLTLSDIDRMPADVYGRRMKDPEFRKLVDKLESEKAVRLARQVQ